MFKAYVLGFSATTVIKRTEFGIKTYRPAVGDDVKLISSASHSERGEVIGAPAPGVQAVGSRSDRRARAGRRPFPPLDGARTDVPHLGFEDPLRRRGRHAALADGDRDSLPSRHGLDHDVGEARLAAPVRAVPVHKSVGITVLALTVLRLGWRIAHRAPPLPDTMPALEKLAAHLGHLGLYALLLGMPLTAGLWCRPLRSTSDGALRGDPVPAPHFPAELGTKASLNATFTSAHVAGVWVMVALVVVHAAAALRHHFVLRDTVLTRMLPRFGQGDV